MFSTFKIGLVTFGMALSISGQILQNRPDLCGAANGAVPLPPGVTAVSDHSQGSSVLNVAQSDSLKSLELGGVSIVEQVCPISENRFVVFGLTGDIGSGYSLEIVDRSSGKSIDSMYAYDARMSPDHRWIVMNKFHPASMMVSVSDEYLLYDLNKSPADNRKQKTEAGDTSAVGSVAYPILKEDAGTDNFNLPDDELHELRSHAFYWSPDSRAFVLLDRFQKTTSIVLIAIDPSGKTSASLYPVQSLDYCDANFKIDDLNVVDAELNLSVNNDRTVRFTFHVPGRDCKPAELLVHTQDFKPAKKEKRRVHHYTNGALDDN